ncbi:MAG: DUF177 domain-containing protein [Anaerolineales bacterium]|nr:DUF177 domain-containing protein [Anaerolineales bacterium]
MTKPHSPLRLNVGFLLRESVGYSREILLDEPHLAIAADLTVEDLRGSLTFTRTPQGLYVSARLQARTTVECSRCLVEFAQTVFSSFSELYHYPPESASPGDSLIPEDMNLDFSAVVREDMLLSLPLQPLCRSDCKGLCPNCGQNWNERPCDCPTDKGDPRLAVLKRLLDNNPPSPPC